MKKAAAFITVIIMAIALFSSFSQIKAEQSNKKAEIVAKGAITEPANIMDDDRISLNLNPMQKEHQLLNMRSHLEAVQTIIGLIAKEDYDKASEVAYTKLGSTTEMKLMCASFGNETFENMGLEFHKSADEMSEVLKSKNKNESLLALATTMNYCVSCHATFKQ